MTTDEAIMRARHRAEQRGDEEHARICDKALYFRKLLRETCDAIFEDLTSGSLAEERKEPPCLTSKSSSN